MPLAPQGLMPAQTPNFAPQQQQAPMQQGKPQKPVVHGLVSGQDIDDRISTMPREAQQAIIKAAATMPDLPTIFGIAIGPEAHDYFAQVAQAVQQHQQNSQAPGTPDASQNPQAAPAAGASAPDASAGGQPPAMATPPAAPQGM